MRPEEAEQVLYLEAVAQTAGANAQLHSHPEARSAPQTSLGITSCKQTAFPTGSFQIAFEVDLGPKGDPQALHCEKLT